MIKLLAPPYTTELVALLADTQGPVVVCAPWVKLAALRPLLRAAPPRERRWIVLTRGVPEDFLLGSSDLEAIEWLVRAGVQVRACKSLHAKLVACGQSIFVGSPNLTGSGMTFNLELAYRIDDGALVSQTRDSILGSCDAAHSLIINQRWIEAIARAIKAAPRSALRRDALLTGIDHLRPPSAHRRPSLQGVIDHAPTRRRTRDGQEVFRYRNDPRPPSWDLWLPIPASPEIAAKDPSALLLWRQEALRLQSMTLRERRLLVRHFVDGAPPGDIASELGLSRQRIHQVLGSALAHLRSNAAPKLSWFGSARNRLLCAFDVPARLRRALEGAVRLAAAVLGIGVSLFPSDRSVVVVELGFARALRTVLRTVYLHARYQTREGLANQLGISRPEMEILFAVEPNLVPAAGVVGWKWPTGTDRLLALAHLAAGNGVTSWHVAHMADALRALFPGMRGANTSAEIMNIVSRAKSGFGRTGGRGMWALVEHTAGPRGNVLAVQEVLAEAGCPLHVTEIHRRLGRDIKEGSVRALLAREPARFESHGHGVFALNVRCRRQRR